MTSDKVKIQDQLRLTDYHVVASVGAADHWRRGPVTRHTELGVDTLSPLSGQPVPRLGVAGLPNVEGVEVEPDLTHLVGRLTHRELTGGGRAVPGREVGVVDTGPPSATPSQAAAHAEAPRTLTQRGASQGLALSRCIARPIGA